MVKSLSVMGITDSDFPMSSITGRANLLLTTSIGGGVHAGIKKCQSEGLAFCWRDVHNEAKELCGCFCFFSFNRDNHAGVVTFWPLVNIKPNRLSGF
ncbi:hypothetical protein AGG97_15230 [Klebsiella michiganensis]|nr:hypothetical protein AGG97_15230 [Klebsiella michiganensis]